MAPAPHYTTSVLLSPRFHQAQIRQVQFRPNTDVCDAIAVGRADLNNLRCYDGLTLQLGPWHHHRRWMESYASIQQCVARLTGDQLKAGYVHSIQTGVNRDNTYERFDLRPDGGLQFANCC